MLRVGFFGTGLMGTPMARNVLRRGFPLAVWNRTASKYAELVAEGATAPGTPRGVAAECDVLISMLVEPAHLQAILVGPDGILAGVRPGTIFIDMSTRAPREAQQLAEQLKPHSIAVIDAPVRGGVGMAADGTLLVMVGGDDAVVARAMPVLEAIGKTVIHAGPVGSGCVAKLAHQLVAVATVEATAEALALAKDFGADQAAVREVLANGATPSPLLKATSEKMVKRDFKPGQPLWVYMKDVLNMDATVDRKSNRYPVGQAALERVRTLNETGRSELDQSALYTLLDP
jgi:3-hydroxyisobutyrate dehydrogenase-like beta-hydroxyacid dehydrogenase